MGSLFTRVMGFLLANFQLAIPFHSQLRVRNGTERQTDRQTDRQTGNGHQRIMPSYGGGGIITEDEISINIFGHRIAVI